ncbi:hypothetical protein QAD02_015904, partial [Eretmocerus hayati]
CRFDRGHGVSDENSTNNEKGYLGAHFYYETDDVAIELNSNKKKASILIQNAYVIFKTPGWTGNSAETGIDSLDRDFTITVKGVADAHRNQPVTNQTSNESSILLSKCKFSVDVKELERQISLGDPRRVLGSDVESKSDSDLIEIFHECLDNELCQGWNPLHPDDILLGNKIATSIIHSKINIEKVIRSFVTRLDETITTNFDRSLEIPEFKQEETSVHDGHFLISQSMKVHKNKVDQMKNMSILENYPFIIIPIVIEKGFVHYKEYRLSQQRPTRNDLCVEVRNIEMAANVTVRRSREKCGLTLNNLVTPRSRGGQIESITWGSPYCKQTEYGRMVSDYLDKSLRSLWATRIGQAVENKLYTISLSVGSVDC